MNESLRRTYLQAMGISVWYARAPLPGAAPSPVFALEQASGTPGLEPEPVADTLEPPKTAVPRRLSSLADSRQPEKTPASPPAPAPQGTPEETGLPSSRWAQLDLGVWQGSQWMLVADWDAKAGAQLQDQLARNVLRAMGETDVKAGRLHWPAFRHPDIPGNDRRSLARTLDNLLGDRIPSGVIVLGEDSRELVDTGPWPGEASRTVRQAFTLSGMAGDAGLKRLLWASLRELKERG